MIDAYVQVSHFKPDSKYPSVILILVFFLSITVTYVVRSIFSVVMTATKFSTVYPYVIHLTCYIAMRHMPGPAEAGDHWIHYSVLGVILIFEAGTVKRDDIDQMLLSKTNTCWGEMGPRSGNTNGS